MPASMPRWQRGRTGEKAIKVPVLDKITHTRHAFNKTEAGSREWWLNAVTATGCGGR